MTATKPRRRASASGATNGARRATASGATNGAGSATANSGVKGARRTNGTSAKNGSSGTPETTSRASRIAEWFRRAAHSSTVWSGSWQFFVVSVIGVIAWALLGPAMGYTDTWQLIINTPTTVLTYLLGILILFEANRQARESKIVHDELLRAIRSARTELIDLHEMTDEELDQVEQELRRRALKSAPVKGTRKARTTTGTRG